MQTSLDIWPINYFHRIFFWLDIIMLKLIAWLLLRICNADIDIKYIWWQSFITVHQFAKNLLQVCISLLNLLDSESAFFCIWFI